MSLFPEKNLRSDAAKRRQAVLDAAKKIFSEEGTDIPIQRIADAAGVGRATVHRNFFDRNGLLLALLDAELDQFAIDLGAVDLRNTPFALFDAFAKLSLTNATLLPQWQALTSNVKDISVVRAKFMHIIEAALPAVIASGAVRTDLVVEDIEIIAGMFSAALKYDSEDVRATQTQRALDIVKYGIMKIA